MILFVSFMANINPQSYRLVFTYFLEPAVPSTSDFADDECVDVFDNSVDLSAVDYLRGKRVRSSTITPAVFGVEVCPITGRRQAQG